MKNSRPHWLRTVFIGRNPRFTFVRILLLVALVFLVRTFAVLPIRVQGQSMLPTYQEDGINFVNRLAYFHSQPRRGDIVAIRYSDEHVMLMKRVVGLPGDTVALDEGRVIVNGETLSEPYVKIPGYWSRAPVTLGENEFFVIGDNRAVSVFGKTERKRIIGKILLWKNLFASSSHSS